MLSEYQEQQLVVEYLELKGHKFTAIPNSTYTKSWKQKTKNRRTGLRAGFPDMVMIICGQFIAIEMKRSNGGVLSKSQRGWIEALQLANIPVRVCKGATQAIKFIQEFEKNEQIPRHDDQETRF